jgi:predicted  nucleic acid-binding Zn-ribbon protein
MTRPSTALRHKRSGNGSSGLAPQPARLDNLETSVIAMQKRMASIEETLNDVKHAWDRMGMSRQAVHDRIEKDRADLDVQFKRIAAMQAEVDILTAREAASKAEIDCLKAKNRSS